MRIPALCLTLALSAGLPALETPLVLRTPGTTGAGKTAIINPASGVIQIYEVQAERLLRWSETNFLVNIEYLSKIIAEDNQTWLQTGTRNNVPLAGEFLVRSLPDNPKNPAASIRQQALASEKAFWSKAPAYDGVVRAAMSDNALAVVVPSTYSIILFRFDGRDLRFEGCHNYRPELYVPTELRSIPSRNDLFQKLPKEVQAKEKEALAKQIQDLEEGGKPIALAPSDPWIVATGQQERMLMIDPPNKKIILYEYIAKANNGEFKIHSVRDYGVDLLITRHFQYNTEPDLRTLLANYNNDLRKVGLKPVSAAYLRKLALRRGVVAEKTSGFQANIDGQGLVTINLAEENKVLVYDTHGTGDKLKFQNGRDYTLEVGIAQHKQVIALRKQAEGLAKRVTNLVDKDTVEPCMRDLKTALGWDPTLVDGIEKDRKIRLYLEKHAEWVPMIQKAEADKKQLEEEAAAIQKELEEEAKTK